LKVYKGKREEGRRGDGETRRRGDRENDGWWMVDGGWWMVDGE
jgi:hypothetical protein